MGLEGVTILDIVNTGALGMMFFLVMRQQAAMEESRKETNAMWRELFQMVAKVAQAAGVGSMEDFEPPETRK